MMCSRLTGEWGKRRCSSVFTTVIDSRSYYGRVRQFVSVRDKGFAIVSWFGEPTYPCDGHVLVVRVSLDGDVRVNGMPQPVVPISTIVSTQVLVEKEGVDSYFVMRRHGIDVRPE